MSRPQLGEADKRAVDMLLDQLPTTRAAAAAGFTSSSSAVAEPQRLDAVRKVLSALDAWDVEEPPADLLAKTLARVDRSPTAGVVEGMRLPSARTLDA